MKFLEPLNNNLNKMLNKKFIASLRNTYLEKNNERRQIISRSNLILNNSKKAIFAIHRDDLKLAKERLDENEDIIKKINKDFGENRAIGEGAFMAGLEEYVEAKLFYDFITTSKIGNIKEVDVPLESYLGGLCDLTGELIRLATNKAIEKKFSEIGKIKDVINEVLNELIDFDITGYLRTKYDQARNNLKKIEQMDYEINLRKL
jgi:predicted translin family RNA/ssDNA-binding protein